MIGARQTSSQRPHDRRSRLRPHSETRPVCTERTIIAGDLVASSNRSPSYRNERQFFGVWIVAMVQKTGVVAAQNERTGQVLRPIRIDSYEIAPDLRQSRHIVVGQDLIKGRMEAPDSRTSGHMLAGEYAIAVNATRPYAGADDKHDAVIEYDVSACCKQCGLPQCWRFSSD